MYDLFCLFQVWVTKVVFRRCLSTKDADGRFNPVYDENIIEDDGYIDTNTYEEPVMNTDSLKQRNLYDLTSDSIYNNIDIADNLYDMASQEPSSMYDFGSNNNEFYDNINEDNEN